MARKALEKLCLFVASELESLLVKVVSYLTSLVLKYQGEAFAANLSQDFFYPLKMVPHLMRLLEAIVGIYFVLD